MKSNVYRLVICNLLLAMMVVLLTITTIIKLKYPIGYNNEILSCSTEYNLDSSLVRAIINVESGYNELAISPKGAVGLMQIMPQTAIWIAEELEEESFNEIMLFEPETNIRYGCFYLRYLFNKYNNEDLVLYAYNAGEGNLQKLLKNNQAFSINNIDIEETKNYIKKVKQIKNSYQKLNNFIY